MAKIELMQLPYETDALEPVISKETIEYHYGKHHKNYVDTANKLLENSNFDEDATLKDIIRESDGALFNNAAQVYNHNFYWLSLTPTPTAIPKKLVELIKRDFGTFQNFKDEFIEKAATLFGSGWTWLELDTKEKLVITQRSNANNPLVDLHEPLLTIDVWEHAYYIDYRNERKKYLEKLWDLIDWKFVASNIVDYYHDLTEPCKEASELCDYIDMLQHENEPTT